MVCTMEARIQAEPGETVMGQSSQGRRKGLAIGKECAETLSVMEQDLATHNLENRDEDQKGPSKITLPSDKR